METIRKNAEDRFRDPFPKSVPGESREETAEGSNCEVAFRDARIIAKGDRTYLNTGIKRYFDTPKKEGVVGAALTATKYYDQKGNLEYTETEIRSSHIKSALKHVIHSDYPGFNTSSKSLIIRDFVHCLFHHRNELREHGRTLKDEEAARHVSLVLEHLYQSLGHSIQKFQQSVDANVDAVGGEPALDFANLWMVFRPGDLVVIKIRDLRFLRRIKNVVYDANTYPGEHLVITVEYISRDAAHFGFLQTVRAICKAQCIGYMPLKDLSVVPLRYLPLHEQDQITKEAQDRGTKFIELATGIHQCEYTGLANIIRVGDNDDKLFHVPSSQMIRGRIMIDSERFCQERSDMVEHVDRKRPRYSTAEDKTSCIPSKDVILADDKVMGFSLVNKEWMIFRIESVRKVRYNKDAFDKLILPPLQKNMIRALVTAHAKGKLGFDDIIEGKGKGMTVLLHGTPGVGKTLTAESIADHAQHPLYAITAADFTDKMSTTEKKLSTVFELAAHWDAVILIDEADVFLTQRNFADIERNALVTVFLRALEYYTGVLILTTNRVTTLDNAFKSRIHLGIKFRPLEASARRQIWQTFIEQSVNCDTTKCVDESFLDELAAHEFDGRMIKNAVRMAHVVAVDEDTLMAPPHLRMAASAIDTFARDMKESEEAGREEQAKEDTTSGNSRKRKSLS